MHFQLCPSQNQDHPSQSDLTPTGLNTYQLETYCCLIFGSLVSLKMESEKQTVGYPKSFFCASFFLFLAQVGLVIGQQVRLQVNCEVWSRAVDSLRRQGETKAPRRPRGWGVVLVWFSLFCMLFWCLLMFETLVLQIFVILSLILQVPIQSPEEILSTKGRRPQVRNTHSWKICIVGKTSRCRLCCFSSWQCWFFCFCTRKTYSCNI